MKPIKEPSWISWLTRPKYCISLIHLRYKRLVKSKEGRRKLLIKTWIIIKRNALLGSVILLTIQITNERNWRRSAESISSDVRIENNFLRGVISMRNSDFQSFGLPWWEKIKRGDSWRFSDLNNEYELHYSLFKEQSLGKSNEQFFGRDIGDIYDIGDNEVWLSNKRRIIKIEPDPLKGYVLVYKYGRLSIFKDSVTSGFTIPLYDVKKAIKEFEKNNKY